MVLAGGRGVRFRRAGGRGDKLLAARGGVPVLVRTVAAAQQAARKVWVVTRADRARRYSVRLRSLGVRIVAERGRHPHHPAEGLLAVRAYLPRGLLLVLAGDLGWLEGRELGAFANRARGVPATALWRRDSSLEPLLAVYDRSVLDRALDPHAPSPLRRMSDLLRSAERVRLVPEERLDLGAAGRDPFRDIDRPADLRSPMPVLAQRPRRARTAWPAPLLFGRARRAERNGDITAARHVYLEEAAELEREGLFDLAEHARRDAARATGERPHDAGERLKLGPGVLSPMARRPLRRTGSPRRSR